METCESAQMQAVQALLNLESPVRISLNLECCGKIYAAHIRNMQKQIVFAYTF